MIYPGELLLMAETRPGVAENLGRIGPETVEHFYAVVRAQLGRTESLDLGGADEPILPG